MNLTNSELSQEVKYKVGVQQHTVTLNIPPGIQWTGVTLSPLQMTTFPPGTSTQIKVYPGEFVYLQRGTSDNHQFESWDIISDTNLSIEIFDMSLLGDSGWLEKFIMPDHDVTITGIWQKISKSIPEPNDPPPPPPSNPLTLTPGILVITAFAAITDLHSSTVLVDGDTSIPLHADLSSAPPTMTVSYPNVSGYDRVVFKIPTNVAINTTFNVPIRRGNDMSTTTMLSIVLIIDNTPKG